jgi:elongation factor P hydroxylase
MVMKNQWKEDLIQKASEMKVMVPKHHYVPSKEMFVTAGFMANAIKQIRQAFNNNPETEFKQSFSAWYPRTAKDIIRHEIQPMIHERINIREILSKSLQVS